MRSNREDKILGGSEKRGKEEEDEPGGTERERIRILRRILEK